MLHSKLALGDQAAAHHCPFSGGHIIVECQMQAVSLGFYVGEVFIVCYLGFLAFLKNSHIIAIVFPAGLSNCYYITH